MSARARARGRTLAALFVLGLCGGCVTDPAEERAEADARMAYGGPSDVEFAGLLWQSLTGAALAGPEAVQTRPYPGQAPHGAVLQSLDMMLGVAGREAGAVLVSRNYDGPGVSPEAVARDPGAYLQSVMVMFRRRAGYDPAHRDWFWARYRPDGTLATDDRGVALAGRLARPAPDAPDGPDTLCLACHRAAPGGDYVFGHDRYR